MVTHDQAEAMTLADRIVVFNDRKIQQVAPPMEIYSRPANTFVARFVGSPAMTIVPAVLQDGAPHATVRLGDGAVVDTAVLRDSLPAGERVEVGLRPESVRVAALGNGATTSGKVELVERLGERSLIYARLADGTQITAEDEGASRAKVGDDIGLHINGSAAHLFGPDGTGYHRQAA
jgi:multiple sugar transport system ATP-binding protein